jgi:hypothetical protein
MFSNDSQCGKQWGADSGAAFAKVVSGRGGGGGGGAGKGGDALDAAGLRERLRLLAAGAKEQLSGSAQVTIAAEGLFEGNSLQGVNITRSAYESLCRPLFERLLTPLREVAIMAVRLPRRVGLCWGDAVSCRAFCVVSFCVALNGIECALIKDTSPKH